MNRLPSSRFEASQSSPVIVATDGREQSDGALRAGALFGGSTDAWRVVSASPLITNVAPEFDLGITAEANDVLRDRQHQLVHDQIRRVGVATDIDVEIGSGSAVLVVSASASTRNAALIIAGLGRHKVVDRLLGDETALAIIRATDKPVLAVPQDFAEMPRNAVVGIDFSDPSICAAQLALRFTHEAATIYLVNVAPRENVLSTVTGGLTAYELRARSELELVASRLDIPPRMHVQAVVRQGDPGSELPRYAEDVEAQLIAVGTRGQGFLARLFLGSVATKVVRASPIAVLTVPTRHTSKDREDG